MEMSIDQLKLIRQQIAKLCVIDGFYADRLKGVDARDIKSRQDFEKIGFTGKEDLRDAYPLGLMAVPPEDVVRIHSSSGTTGKPVIIPYTRKDVEDWAEMFARCYRMAGVTNLDRIHITPGYGLWTAGIGFQAGAELLGAMCVPMGPGNTDKQLKMMVDMETTVLCATSSYALLLAEEIEKRNLYDQIKLRVGVIGSERWGEKMRRRIADTLHIKLYDIYGLTEIYGPGIGISCDEDAGMHIWDDFLYIEVVDPVTGAPVPDGTVGELVITTLKKQGAPLIRYRTHDLTRIIPGQCACGSRFPRIGTIVGRTDDMVKIKGVNIFPSQIDDLLVQVDGASSEFRFTLDHAQGRDCCTLAVECEPGVDQAALAETLAAKFKSQIGVTAAIELAPIGGLPRSEKKTKRVIDNR
ncbi:MAG TPA: phenylacetate--CoA ligase [Candidatus Limiplasma sp.]|nr:phenylacetate--CoA ligase [Candidatus Limiplasma sp.]